MAKTWLRQSAGYNDRVIWFRGKEREEIFHPPAKPF
jgi:hypothetical protein